MDLHGERSPAVAGTFYPGRPRDLRTMVTRLLDAAHPPTLRLQPRMVVVPHAGFVYSGPVAATAYAALVASGSRWRTVLIVGPSHFDRFAGSALTTYRSFVTPLGALDVDADLDRDLSLIPGVVRRDRAHAREHSLEVQLPFLQVALGSPLVVLVVTGDDDDGVVGDVIRAGLHRHDVLVVISSDLSHYHDHATATALDARTASSIVAMQADEISSHAACGAAGVRGCLGVAVERGWECRQLDLRNSGDTAGSPARVVGYGAFALGPGVG